MTTTEPTDARLRAMARQIARADASGDGDWFFDIVGSTLRLKKPDRVRLQRLLNATPEPADGGPTQDGEGETPAGRPGPA